MGEHKLRGIVLRCLEDDSEERPDAEELVEWLQQENTKNDQKRKIAESVRTGRPPKLKVVPIGQSGTGKTCIVQRFLHNSFSENGIPTMGFFCDGKNITLHNKKFYLEVLDTVGQELYHGLPQNFARGADGVILIFDLTRKATLTERVPAMLEIVSRHIVFTTRIVLVGNKVDVDKSKRQVTRPEAEEYARHLGASYIETSAKTGENIERVFEEVANQIYDTLDLSDVETYFPGAEQDKIVLVETDSRVKTCRDRFYDGIAYLASPITSFVGWFTS